MKKTLAILLTIILVLAMGTMAVSAASASPEVNGVISGAEIKDKQEKDVDMDFEKIDGKVTTEFQDNVKELKKESGVDNLKVVAQYNVKAQGNPEYPVKVTLDVLGVSADSKVYVMVQEDNNVKTIETKVVNGKITFSIEKAIQKFAIVVDKATAQNVEKENNVLSPQTGDFSMAVVVMGVIALMAVAFGFKKVKA